MSGIHIGDLTFSFNILTGNSACNGGGVMFVDTFDYDDLLVFSGNAITDKAAIAWGGGLYCDACLLSLDRNTISGNTAGSGGGIAAYDEYIIAISNTILWGDEAANGPEVAMFPGPSMYPQSVAFICGDLEGGEPAVYMGGVCDEYEFTFRYSFDANPLFCDPEHGDYAIAATSPCAAAQQPDCGLIGALGVGCGTLSAQLACVPAIGTLPFPCNFTVVLRNVYEGHARRLAGHLDFDLAGGQHWSNWKAGFVNVAAGGSFVTSWSQSIPALYEVLGSNVITLEAMDVTPSPYNQPPYLMAGDIDTDTCTVVGLHP